MQKSLLMVILLNENLRMENHMGNENEFSILKDEKFMSESSKLEVWNDLQDFPMGVYMNEKLNNENVIENELWDIQIEWFIRDDLKIIGIIESEFYIVINLTLNESS